MADKKDRVFMVESDYIMALNVKNTHKRNFSEIGFEHFRGTESLEEMISKEGFEGVRAVVLDDINFEDALNKFRDEFEKNKIPYIAYTSLPQDQRENLQEEKGVFDYIVRGPSFEDYVGVMKRALEYSSDR